MPHCDPEKKKAYQKAYRENNRGKAKEYQIEYRENNREKRKEYDKTQKGIKCRKTNTWKVRGIRCDDEWDEVYEWFSSTTNCNICDKLFVESSDKCLDHDHHLEGYNVRGVLCQKCNHYQNEIYH